MLALALVNRGFLKVEVQHRVCCGAPTRRTSRATPPCRARPGSSCRSTFGQRFDERVNEGDKACDRVRRRRGRAAAVGSFDVGMMSTPAPRARPRSAGSRGRSSPSRSARGGPPVTGPIATASPAAGPDHVARPRSFPWNTLVMSDSVPGMMSAPMPMSEREAMRLARRARHRRRQRAEPEHGQAHLQGARRPNRSPGCRPSAAGRNHQRVGSTIHWS